MRKLRELQQGVWYEIQTQINNRELLFREDKAREIFRQVFHETELRFTFGIQGLSFEGDLLKFYSEVWFNTPRLAAVQTTYCFQKPGIKPDGIINFLSNEPPFRPTQR
ncbi:MAG: hypothetical protein LBP80_06055 [Treponema sp.]|nr:hypothetical protein [Treponema sp.]